MRDLSETEREARVRRVAAVLGAGDAAASLAGLSQSAARVRRARLAECLGIEDGSIELEDTLAKLEGAGLVKPVRSSGVMPGGVKLYARYALTVPGLSDDERARAEEDIRALDLRLSTLPGLFGRPGLFLDYETEFKQLSRYLLAHVGAGIAAAGTAERCYEIWGDEKILDPAGSLSPGFSSALKTVGFDLGILNMHATEPDDFVSFLLPYSRGAVVVSENQDFYDSLCRMLGDGPLALRGLSVSGTVFGRGNFAVSRARASSKRTFSRLAAFAASGRFSGRAVIYVGDIDPTGLRIQQQVEDQAGIPPAREIYEAMCLLHRRRRDSGGPVRPIGKNQIDSYDAGRFLSLLSPDAAAEASWALSNGVRIPQEIISLPVMRRERGAC